VLVSHKQAVPLTETGSKLCVLGRSVTYAVKTVTHTHTHTHTHIHVADNNIKHMGNLEAYM
jgi:hypothetical protein